MSIAFAVRASALLLLASHMQAAVTPERLEQLASELQPKLIEWRRDIHQHPEWSNREFRTAKKVETQLRALGLEVKAGIAHTGVAAVLRGGRPGPVIALRADMDALPVTEKADLPFKSTATGTYLGEKVGVMHACGHDTHVAILMAAAQALAGVRAELPGTILFIFQPAEEGAPEEERGGAQLMLEEGLFDIVEPEAVFGLHVTSQLNSGVIGYRPGPFMAGSDRFRMPSLRRVAGENGLTLNPLETGAEDFSYYAARTPSLFFYIGITPPDQDPATAPINHSPLFYVDEGGLILGLRALLNVAVDYLTAAPAT